MSVSVRTRFEVFKRDRFTCSYCGRTPPEVLLECDHIVPRAAGGSDEITNLTTACSTCNSGKSARLLEEGTAPVVGRATVEELAERVEQAKAYMELLGGMQSVVDRQWGMIVDAWAKAFGATAIEKEDGTYWQFEFGRFPDERSVRTILRRLALADVLDAIDITASRMDRPNQDACRYFYGVCWRSIKEDRSPASPPVQSTPGEYESGVEHGRALERQRIGDLLLHPEDSGFEDLKAAIAALWGDDA